MIKPRFLVVAIIVLSLSVAIIGFWRFALQTHTSSYSKPLQANASGLDSLKVYFVDPMSDNSEPAWSLSGVEEIATFIDLIEVDDTKSGFHCMCFGDFRFDFERNGEPAMVLTYHHGQSIRWIHGKWRDDGMLTPVASTRIPQWFAHRGFTALKEARDMAIAEAEHEAREQNAFVSCFPEHVRALFNHDDGSVIAGKSIEESDANTVQELARQINDPVVVAIAASRSLAIENESWTTSTSRERIAISAAQTVSGDDFLRALESLTNDEIGLIGAARLFFYEDLAGKISEPSVSHPWTVRLAEITLQQGHDENKPTLLRRLWTHHDPQIIEMLARVMRGEIGVEIERKRSEEPGIRAGAALALAMLSQVEHRRTITELVEELTHQSDMVAIDVALAAFGDNERLNKMNALLPSYSIGLGVIEVVERTNGRHGMDLLVSIISGHPWAMVNESGFHAFERITGQNWSGTTPHYRAISYTAELVDWWNQHREEFLQSRATANGP